MNPFPESFLKYYHGKLDINVHYHMHEVPNRREPHDVTHRDQDIQRHCRTWLQNGMCNQPGVCRRLHVDRKTIRCKYQSKCNRNPCPFGHSDVDPPKKKTKKAEKEKTKEEKAEKEKAEKEKAEKEKEKVEKEKAEKEKAENEKVKKEKVEKEKAEKEKAEKEKAEKEKAEKEKAEKEKAEKAEKEKADREKAAEEEEAGEVEDDVA